LPKKSDHKYFQQNIKLTNLQYWIFSFRYEIFFADCRHVVWQTKTGFGVFFKLFILCLYVSLLKLSIYYSYYCTQNSFKQSFLFLSSLIISLLFLFLFTLDSSSLVFVFASVDLKFFHSFWLLLNWKLHSFQMTVDWKSWKVKLKIKKIWKFKF